jgi:2-methylfumaryl-CoA isomerase
MTLAQLGADVIRFDQIGGGIDAGRWPLSPSGESLFWAGMNKGKKSILVDLGCPAGRELVTALITAPGSDAGLFLTNFPARGWLSYELLAAHRSDVVMIALQGNADGSSEVDYTVHPATGFPWATGPKILAEPLNSVLPTWDLLLGSMAATALLAAERVRSRTGRGDLVHIALSDVAFSVVGHLGRIAQVQLGGADSMRDGNYLYGAFGHDFETNDGRRVMVVALTARQWAALKKVTGLESQFLAVGETFGVDLETESGRYELREMIEGILRPWFASRSLVEVRASFAGSGVSWGPYQTFTQLVEEDPRCSTSSSLFEEVHQPGIGSVLTPGSVMRFGNSERLAPEPAPVLGQHTEQVLAEILALGVAEIGRLFDTGVVAGPSGAHSKPSVATEEHRHSG